MQLPMDTESLIPHRATMRLVDVLLESDGTRGCARVLFERDSPFVIDKDGRIEPMILLELVAQTYAASKGYEDLSVGATPQNGYLVGITHMDFRHHAYAGEELTVKVESDEHVDNFYFADGVVCHEEQLLLETKLKFWLNPES